MIILGVKYIFVIPIHAKTEARQDIAKLITGCLIFGIGIIISVFTAAVVTPKATAGLDTHAPAINIAMHMEVREKICPVGTKRKI